MRKNTNAAQTLAALILLVAFALGLFAAVLGGAACFRRLTRDSGAAFDRRTAQGYLLGQVRQAEAVSLEPFGPGQALCLHQSIDGEVYWTRIYCHDGWLMELFSRKGADFSPEDGTRILPLDVLSLSMENGLLTLELSLEGWHQQLYWEVFP